MFKLRNLVGLAFMTGFVHAASAAVYTTGPVSTGKPANITNRSVWCVAQNLDKKAQQVKVEVWYGNQPSLLCSDSYVLQPNQTSGWRVNSGASGGMAQVYCKFTVADKKDVRGYITAEDDFATVLVLEAQ